MIVYSTIFFINALACYCGKRDKKILKYFVIALLILMTGTRYYMGGLDIRTYEGVYNNVPNLSILFKFLFFGIENPLINTNYETGFLILCSLIKTFHFNFFGFTLIWTIIFYSILIKGLDEFVPNWSIFIAVFMYKIMFYNTFISIRQGLTMALFCYSLKYIRDRKWYIYFPFCFFIFLMHNGAIILFPLYFINYLPISKKFIKKFAIALLPTWFISSSIDMSSVIMKVANFIGNTHSASHWAESVESISILHTLECYAIIFMILVFYKKIMTTKKTKEMELILRLVIISIPLFTLFRSWIIFTREKDYFVMMYGIILGYILEGNTTTIVNSVKGYITNMDFVGYKNFKIISAFIFLICFIGIFRYVVRFDGGVLWNYTSYLTKGVSIFDF